MSSWSDIESAFREFSIVGAQFCAVVESAPGLDRVEFLSGIYEILPRLIHQGIVLPAVSSSDPQRRKTMTPKEWEQMYESLKGKLGEWDLYWQVFDPMKDSEAIRGSLADDLADIYRDVSDGLGIDKTGLAFQQDAIFTWRVLYYSHWGQHAMNALYAIHFFLNEHLG